MTAPDRRRAMELQLKGYRLATAEIIYHMPDHPGVLQSFIWQHYDVAPHYPVLKRFLAFWKGNLDGALHSVRVTRAEIVSAHEVRSLDGFYELH